MLLARVAEQAYWGGRYLERVEDMARIVHVHGETHVDLPVGADIGWRPLLDVCGSDRTSGEGWDRAPSNLDCTREGVGQAGERVVVEHVVADRDNPSSILRSLEAARENLRAARPVIPREVWELVNDLWLNLSSTADQIASREIRVQWLRRAMDECARVNGVLVSTMRRDEAMAFISIGQQIERAEMTARLIRARADDVGARERQGYDEVHWMALLRCAAAYQPFRRAMPARPDNGAALRFLLQDEAFPRAVSSCLSELRSTLKRLPENEDVLAACTDASVLVADAPVDRLSVPQLRHLASDLQESLLAIHQALVATYFRPGVPPASVSSPGASLLVREAGCSMPDDSTESSSPERRYRVRHRTFYEYQGPVEQSYNEAHLRPRSTDRQRCTSYSLAVEPEAASHHEYLDPFGNWVSTFVVSGGFESLSVTAASEVHLSAVAPPTESPPWESAVWLLDIDNQATARQARQFRAPSRLIPASDDLVAYALPSFTPRRPLIDAVVELAARIHQDFAYEPGFTSVTTPVLDVMRHRRGVCQDFAHVAIGCVRSMGLAARYVSGYLETVPAAGQPKLLGVDASHAWLAVLVPGFGWIDVDPTNDQLITESYVTTAWGRDYWDVAPLRGSVEGGGSSHRLEVAVDVTPLWP
jgi:uncharacterized alpha-E superfamily protein/transglutaminase-like putative cysteine protease